MPPLEQLSSTSGGSSFVKYAVCYLAVHRLLGPGNLRPLAQYFVLRREEQPPATFEAAFGKPLDEFYSEFAHWRSTQGI